MKNLIQRIKFNEDGLTMVEMIIAVAVFLTVVSVVFGIFVRSVRVQHLVNDVMLVNSNASLGLEQIMRELRSGFDFEVCDAGGTCTPNGFGVTLKFTRVRGNATTTVVYARNAAAGDIERTEGISPATVLTAADVDVKRLYFSLIQEIASDPWRVSMFLQIGPRSDPAPENTINLQTTVSARVLPSELVQ